MKINIRNSLVIFDKGTKVITPEMEKLFEKFIQLQQKRIKIKNENKIIKNKYQHTQANYDEKLIEKIIKNGGL